MSWGLRSRLKDLKDLLAWQTLVGMSGHGGASEGGVGLKWAVHMYLCQIPLDT